MSTFTMSQAQERLQECVRAAADDFEPVVILRPDAPAAVLVNYDEFRSMAETLHVLGSRENALRLLEAMKEMDEGRNCVTVDPREFFAK